MAVICRGRDATPPGLKEALVRRGFRVEEVGTTYEAIGRSVIHARQDSSGRAVVVLVEPTRLSRPHELLAALANTAPNAICWVYKKAGSAVELRAVTDSDVAAWQGSGKNADTSVVSAAAVGSSVRTQARPANDGAARAYEERGASPALKLAGDWQGSAAEVPASGSAELPPPVLTDEELAMLLGDETSAEPEA